MPDTVLHPSHIFNLLNTPLIIPCYRQVYEGQKVKEILKMTQLRSEGTGRSFRVVTELATTFAANMAVNLVNSSTDSFQNL